MVALYLLDRQGRLVRPPAQGINTTLVPPSQAQYPGGRADAPRQRALADVRSSPHQGASARAGRCIHEQRCRPRRERSLDGRCERCLHWVITIFVAAWRTREHLWHMAYLRSAACEALYPDERGSARRTWLNLLDTAYPAHCAGCRYLRRHGPHGKEGGR